MTATTDAILQTDALASYVGPALIQRAQFAGAVMVEKFLVNGSGVKTVKFRKGGYLTAATVSEGANYTFPSTRTQTGVSATAEKKVSGDAVTVEALKFASDFAGQQRTMQMIGAALGRLLDTDIKALFPSLASAVTAAGVMTLNEIMDGIYTIGTNMVGNSSGNLIYAGSLKNSLDLAKDLKDQVSSFIANSALKDLLGLDFSFKMGERGYKGKLLGVDIFETTGLTQSGGDDIGAMWDREHCFGVAFDTIPSGDTEMINSEVIINKPRADNGMKEEITGHTYWKAVEVNDEAGTRIRADQA